jgi:hypothetical protein
MDCAVVTRKAGASARFNFFLLPTDCSLAGKIMAAEKPR